MPDSTLDRRYIADGQSDRCSSVADATATYDEFTPDRAAACFDRGMNKSDLPTKICPVCCRPFTWRKKWRNCWDEVRYCSKRCRGEARQFRRTIGGTR